MVSQCDRKKPPSWASVVGVMGLIFGLSGMGNGAYEIAVPYIFALQQQIMDAIEETGEFDEPSLECSADNADAEWTDSDTDDEYAVEEEGAGEEALDEDEVDADTQAQIDEITHMMADMFATPPWYQKWTALNGSLALLLGAAYLLASIFLLLLRPGAPRLFMWVAGLSICRGVMAASVVASSFSIMMLWSGLSAVVGILIDVVLIIVVSVSDRSAYAASAENVP